ncbi:MAG: hypothetical protein V4550_14625 [Gemmatimonadota bacterium]
MSSANNWIFVGAAFAVTWAVLVGYFLRVQRKLRAARVLLDSANTMRSSAAP